MNTRERGLQDSRDLSTWNLSNQWENSLMAALNSWFFYSSERELNKKLADKICTKKNKILLKDKKKVLRNHEVGRWEDFGSTEESQLPLKNISCQQMKTKQWSETDQKFSSDDSKRANCSATEDTIFNSISKFMYSSKKVKWTY